MSSNTSMDQLLENMRTRGGGFMSGLAGVIRCSGPKSQARLIVAYQRELEPFMPTSGDKSFEEFHSAVENAYAVADSVNREKLETLFPHAVGRIKKKYYPNP